MIAAICHALNDCESNDLTSLRHST